VPFSAPISAAYSAYEITTIAASRNSGASRGSSMTALESGSAPSSSAPPIVSPMPSCRTNACRSVALARLVSSLMRLLTTWIVAAISTLFRIDTRLIAEEKNPNVSGLPSRRGNSSWTL
jgi:hypothetical protein